MFSCTSKSVNSAQNTNYDSSPIWLGNRDMLKIWIVFFDTRRMCTLHENKMMKLRLEDAKQLKRTTQFDNCKPQTETR